MPADSTANARPEPSTTPTPEGALGVNAWLVEEMYEEYLINPASVSESWREFFTDYKSHRPVEPVPSAGPSIEPSVPAATPASASPAVVVPETLDEDERAEPLRGVPRRIAENMVASLSVPTATSVHPVPAKLIELNRALINEHLTRTAGGKVSITHLIAWAVVKALGTVPALNASFVPSIDDDGTPGIVRHLHVGLGLAIDVTRGNGQHSLVVPVIRDADLLDFDGFLHSYEAVIRKARTNKLAVEDFGGVTVTITNPGVLGTTQSVPRLLPGQGAIVGVGSVAYPAEYAATDPAVLAELGLGKVVTVTSTYDHRIIQGAESGLFLQRIHELLIGKHDFYIEIFASLQVPTTPVVWLPDRNPSARSERLRTELERQTKVQALINMYRVRGHLIAQLDPLSPLPPELRPDLDPASYGLTLWDRDRTFLTDGLAGSDDLTLSRILEILRGAYCQTIGLEYMHIQRLEEKRWIQEQVEGASTTISPEEQRHILGRLNAAEAFERFLHLRYVGQKRFGLEGAESTIPFLDAVLDEAARRGISEAVLGMAHRGRLNVLANIVGKSYAEIFAEFEGNLDPDSVQGSGDVKYHKGASGKWPGRDGMSLPITLASNPSHLEAVDAVVEGIARAKIDQLRDFGEFPVLPILVHGDAAFAGQGVVAETLNLSLLKGYRTGGTVHLVINNQLGFTTPPEQARSSFYATDVAKMVQAPIIHVNGDDPEACVRVARLAVAYRQQFHRDVVVEIVCYRLHGHNEGDDPSYTQPLMYKKIEAHRSVRKIYTENLVKRGDITLDEAERALADFSALLQLALDETRSSSAHTVHRLPERSKIEIPRLTEREHVDQELLDGIIHRLHTPPPGFTVHPKLWNQIVVRHRLYESGSVDWALAEALALGSLVLKGTDVRLTGQDTRRGTFSHRHATLVDYETGDEYTPLAHLADPLGDEPPLSDGRVGNFIARDSLLSEYAALGFEYGYSVEAREALVCWEAQFGDFANGAQIIIDNFLVAAEEKWGQSSSLVLLLPHGYEGQGAEHSSARLERFLALAANGNITIAQPTTSAQYFHLLRAQSQRSVRRPLIVMTPKSLLRAAVARSSVADLIESNWREVLDDPELSIEAGSVDQVVLCSGKIAYDAIARRNALLAASSRCPVAIVRMEQLYPWPTEELSAVFGNYSNARRFIFLQDEPENMGSWNYVRGQFHRSLDGTQEISHITRHAAGSPATGSHSIHELELEQLLDEAVGPLPSAT